MFNDKGTELLKAQGIYLSEVYASNDGGMIIVCVTDTSNKNHYYKISA